MEKQGYSFARVLVALCYLLNSAFADDDCSGNGMKAYVGPNNRFICACDRGWVGQFCDTLASPLFEECDTVGQQGDCADGLQCATWADGVDRCTCDPDSTNSACSDENLSGCAGGCKDGFECKPNSVNKFCACAPFSTADVCQCDGTFQDNPGQCMQGSDGTCMTNTGDKCYMYPNIAFGVGPSACPSGKALNAQGMCVCVPLSTNPDCKPPKPTTSTTSYTDPAPTTATNPTPTAPPPPPVADPKPPPPPAAGGSGLQSSSDTTSGMVCVKLSPGCNKAYSLKYWVFQPGKTVTKGKAKVDPKKNVLSTMKGIKAGQKYEICVRPATPGSLTFSKQGCTRVPGPTTCCKMVTAAAGQKPTGCADMGKNYEAATC